MTKPRRKAARMMPEWALLDEQATDKILSQSSTSIPDPPTPLRTAGGKEAVREHGPPTDRTRDVKRG